MAGYTINDQYSSSSARNQQSVEYPEVDIFPRKHLGWMIALSLLTLGLYVIFWMVSRASIMNARSEYPISSGLITMTVIFTLISVAALVGSFVFYDEYSLKLLYIVTLLVTMICMVVLIFKIRDRLNVMTESHSDDRVYLNGLQTFLFSSFYVQYKINEIISINDGY